MKETSTEVLLVVRHNDTLIVNEILRQMGVEYPIYFDSIGNFKKINGIFDNPIYQTFIINKMHEVVWLGCPFENPKTWQLYKQFISKQNEGTEVAGCGQSY